MSTAGVLETAVFTVPGEGVGTTRCLACANRACEALKTVPGVAEVECDPSGGSVRVGYDPARVSESDLAAEMERFGLEVGETYRHAAWRVTGLDCPDCARTVKTSVERLDGVLAADLNFASATLLIEYDTAADPRAEVVRTVTGTGHGLEALDAGDEAITPERAWYDVYRAEVATVGSGAFSAVGMVLGWLGAPVWLASACYATAIAFGGFLVWRRVLGSLKARVLDMNVLMTLAVIGAAALGEWGEGATVYFLFALGGLLEARSLERTRRSIRALMDLTPATARVRRESGLVEVPVGEVAVGDTLVVRPGERMPVDGVIAIGETAVDESPVTGESVPVAKAVGDQVFSGTLNETGLIDVVASAAAQDSTIARIVYMVEEAQASRAPSQTFVERFSRGYTPTVIALAAAIAVVPSLVAVAGGVWTPQFAVDWVFRALVLLVVSCPCALVISTPVSIVSGITRASKDGVLVKGGAFLETAAKVRAVAFDKTGTLTTGRPEVAEVRSLGAGGPRAAADDELLAVAGALEAHSNHPIARAVVRAAGEEAHPGEVTGFSEVAGRGVRGGLAGAMWEICSPARAQEVATLTAADEELIGDAESRGLTVLVVVRNGVALGYLGVADAVRPETREVVAALGRGGIAHTVMLTGDNERVADGVAAAAGLTERLARLLPGDKTEAVRSLRERHGVVAMVGDGVNDAPALAAADIGIAMGAAGSDTALETADVALMRDDLTALPGFFALARRTRATIVENVVFSIAVKVVFLGLAIAGKATLWMAVFADTGVALLVILNGMRLLTWRRA